MNEVTQAIESSMNVTWNDVLEAQAATAPENFRIETITDDIDIPADPIRIATQLVEVDERIKAQRTAVDSAKAELKGKKTDLEEIEAERDELIEALRTKVQTVTGTFKVVTDLRTLTERWFDADTGVFLRECPMPAEKRQENLPFDLASDDLDEDDGAPDSTTNLTGDPDAVDGVALDAEGLLDAAANGTDPEHLDPPSKPIKRGRKKAEVAS